MNLIPPVRAELAERYIFNFRMPLEAMADYLPVSWLSPQSINGYGVASFCVLDLRHITAAPLPTSFGLKSVSCAPRYAVLDHSDGARPAVFVTERQTSSAFGAWFTGLGFSCRHPYAPASIRHRRREVELSIDLPDGEPQFHATVRRGGCLASEFFPSSEKFAAFIAQGVTSYGLSRHPNRLTKVDLHKDDHGYEALDVLSLEGPMLDRWLSSGAVLDSAFRTQGGRYQWTYHGLRDTTASNRAEVRQ